MVHSRPNMTVSPAWEPACEPIGPADGGGLGERRRRLEAHATTQGSDTTITLRRDETNAPLTTVLFLGAASAQRTCRHRALPGSGEAELPGSGPRCRTRRIRFYRRFRLSRLHARSCTVRVFRGRYRGRCAKLVRRCAAKRHEEGFPPPGRTLRQRMRPIPTATAGELPQPTAKSSSKKSARVQ